MPPRLFVLALASLATFASYGDVVDGLPGNAANAPDPSDTLRVGAEAKQIDGEWVVTMAIMSRSARELMEGFVHVPGDSFQAVSPFAATSKHLKENRTFR